MDPADDPARDGSDAAEQAFTVLRDEVTALRLTVEATNTILAGQAATAPDYNLTLGAMTKELQGITRHLAAIDAHPALRLTPEQHAQRLTAAGIGPMREAAQRFDHAALAAEDERRQLAHLIGTVRRQDQQRTWLAWTGLAAFALGLLTAPVLAGLLPFGLDGQVAAAIMHADRWHAGSSLMADASPEGWNEIVAAINLARANDTVLKACRAAAQKTGKEQRCAVTVPAS